MKIITLAIAIATVPKRVIIIQSLDLLVPVAT